MQIPVLIIGGGPVGLASSLFLSQLGVRHLLVERHPGTSTHPKAMGLHMRTLELLRPSGVAADLEARALPADWTHSTCWVKSLFGDIIREISIFGGDAVTIAGFSPCRALHCPQTITEEVLQHRAVGYSTADLRFFHELISFEQDDEAVRAKILDRNTNETITVDAEYMIAADGTHGETREKLGIERLGPPDLGHFANIYFGAEIGDELADRKAVIYNCLSPSHFGSVVAIDGKSQWLMHHFLEDGETLDKYTHDFSAGLIEEITGIPKSEVTIFGVKPWVMSAQIASKFGVGRVYLTGDAAHRTTPAGGLGLNTGLQSAQNLCWKLGAVLNGWCDASLLDTYDTERRPVVMSNIEASRGSAGGLFPIVEAALTGHWDDAVRLIHQLPPTHNQIGRDLGYRYTIGAFSGVADEPPSDFSKPFEQEAVVGGRLPHVWLPEQDVPTSTVDLCKYGFVILCEEADAEAYLESVKLTPSGAIAVKPVAASVIRKDFKLGPGSALLLRPDGFIGWIGVGAAEMPEVLQDLKLG